MKTLKDLAINTSGKVISVSGKGATKQHLLDMGIIPGTIIKYNKSAPLGDPMEFKLRGYTLTLRKDDAKTIKIVDHENIIEQENVINNKTIHPGLGEDGIKFHNKKTENPLSDDEVLTFALVGNQNAGKTTLFNQLTGSNQHAGNFPGVTVDRKDGVIRNYPNTLITDLPGIYSMSPYTPEELVSRDFILNQKPKGIINVLDATSIERGLYLTMQLLELDIPMVLALNMIDEIENNGGYIDVNALENALGIPVIPISASKNQGIDELIEHAIHVTKYQEKPRIQDYCDPNMNPPIHRCLHQIMHMIEDHCNLASIPIRFAAAKCAENDLLIIKRLQLSQNEIETLGHITKEMEDETKLDKAEAIADMRYSFISKVTKNNVIKPQITKEQALSSKIDKFLTGKYTAIPAFILIMLSIFYLTFQVIGPYFENIIALGINKLTDIIDIWMTNNNVNPILHSLVIDGVFKGVGSILSFLPIIVILFFFLSVLEDSGYMARVAFFMDKLLRKIGLSGRSIVPLIIGFGCSVPSVMATRTLPSDRDRKMTILLAPFMSCSAKLPIYGFLAKAFFPSSAGFIMIALYLLGIAMGVLFAYIFKNSYFKGEPVPFVMELPSYRLPSFKSVMLLLWDKAKDFLQRAFSVIFIATMIIWFLQNFNVSLNFINDNEQSILAMLASYIAPIFKPLGFNNWQVVVSLITGFLAKETVVSTLQVLLVNSSIQQLLSTNAALSLLTFCLLYTPCIATISAIKKELDIKWAIFVIVEQCLIAYIAAFIIYNISLLII